MDPAAVVMPDVSGHVTIAPGITLHFELFLPATGCCSSHGTQQDNGESPDRQQQRGGQQNGNHGDQQQRGGQAGDSPTHQQLRHKLAQLRAPRQPPRAKRLLMVMGAFATKAHFASTARFLADAGGYEVLIYDHRGVGLSGRPVLEQQTCRMLAEDAVAVVDAIWGPDAALHVHGASMGGMVAQELALLLLPQRRLLSLGLAVTCRGLRPLYGLLAPLFVPQVLRAFLAAWYGDSRPQVLVRRVMALVLPRGLLAMRHPSGDTYEQVYYREWLARFDHFWTFRDHAAGACHACVCLNHWLPERKIAVLRDCGVPILCQVATRDRLIPAAMQLELADKLRAKTVCFPTGHMGLLPWKERYHAMLLEHLAAGDALRGVREAEWRWSDRSLPFKLLAVNCPGGSSDSSASSSSNGDSVEPDELCALMSASSSDC